MTEEYPNELIMETEGGEQRTLFSYDNQKAVFTDSDVQIPFEIKIHPTEQSIVLKTNFTLTLEVLESFVAKIKEKRN
jgi:hypothetical protein